MEVKEIRNDALSPDASNAASKTLQKSTSALAAPVVAEAVQSPVSIEITSRDHSVAQNDLRAQLNDLINVVNIAAQATTDIEGIVKSISGIVEQATNPELPDHRRATLEREGNALVDELKKAVNTTTPSGLKPLAGDKVRLEVEEKLGKTLEFILPDHSKDSFGISKISFSAKDSIIQTQTSIQTAREQIEKLRKAVDETKDVIQEKVTEVEVAFQNKEASESSIRDLDEALRVATETQKGIGTNPDSAIRSFGGLGKGALGLLD
jgi:flagellin-like hook-associated protein FlgL